LNLNKKNMNKDELVEQMLKEKGNKNNSIDLDAYARGLIDMYDKLVSNNNFTHKVWSAQDILNRSEGLIFASGITTDDANGCNMTSSGKELRWVAKRGYGNDWAIYIYWSEENAEWIAANGDKVHSKSNIQKLLSCTDDALQIYRY